MKGHAVPSAAPRPCSHPGCGVLVSDGTGRCPKHPKKAWARNRPAPIKRLSGRALQRLREDRKRENPLCVECKRRGEVRLWDVLDHVIPLEEGGTNDPGNLQGLCHDCHGAKTERERRRGIQRAWAGYREG
ncbi:HNH endonuclease [Comamonas terrigena]|uniref:HNH endonuclease n=1 Tax=Comamonas terrigena TaxID=32013 RepID=UPI00244CCC2B|nr:HNH endonuclease signature motif containing protein [Comamonas terrigena]MDH0049642.1 HNH endonuclease [Comamonas terrigena]MDH0511294.1 HNH endonuclease [Comamonas terrigena]MDH1091403.1 HNH endonuclease [Comamonas terrigena]